MRSTVLSQPIRATIAAVALLCGGVGAVDLAEAGGATSRSQTPVAVRTTISADEWRTYRSRFVDTNGRVIDREKDGVSHSEGQGYGMLLAVKAGDRATFDAILSFTVHKMRARPDALTSWLYDPRQSPRIADTNNAADGDILIAYALLKAAVRWHEPRYVALAEPMIDDIGRLLLVRRGDRVLVRPAAFGFDRRSQPDGPVINLSYYIYGAFLLFAEIDDRHPWLEAWQSGLQLTEDSLAGRDRHAPDWVALASDDALVPAQGFGHKSSYDAVRIPLYMALGGRVPASYLAPFDRTWNVLGNRAPRDHDLASDRTVMDMNDLGYRAIAAIAACAVRGVPIPASLQNYRNTSYFSSSLHLLTLSAAREHYPHCVRAMPRPDDLIASADRSERTTIYAGSARRASVERQPQRHRWVPARQSDYGHFAMGG